MLHAASDGLSRRFVDAVPGIDAFVDDDTDVVHAQAIDTDGVRDGGEPVDLNQHIISLAVRACSQTAVGGVAELVGGMRSSVIPIGDGMSGLDVKGDLHTYLRDARETLVWKLDGLGEYDIRRPLTPTGTNLLGLVKHSGSTHARYFGEVFGRPDDLSPSWLSRGAEPSAELWAAPDEARDDIFDGCRRAWHLADATINELPLEAVGQVPWWGDVTVTLHRVLVHVTAETQRHAGHADIVRELIDGSAGLLEGFDNLQLGDRARWGEFRDQVEAAARLAGGN